MFSILNSFRLSSSTRVRSVEIIINFNFGHCNYADTLLWPYIAILTAWLMPGLCDPDICLAFLRLIEKPIKRFCISSAITNLKNSNCKLQTANGQRVVQDPVPAPVPVAVNQLPAVVQWMPSETINFINSLCIKCQASSRSAHLHQAPPAVLILIGRHNCSAPLPIIIDLGPDEEEVVASRKHVSGQSS